MSSRSATNGNGTRPAPHNLQAEESLLGAMLCSWSAVAEAVEQVGPSDFHKPSHGHVFAAMESLYRQGQPSDPVTVADELRRAGLLDGIGGPATLVTLQANTPAISNAARYARIVAETSAKRRLVSLGHELVDMGYEPALAAEEVVDRTLASLQGFDLPLSGPPPGITTVDALVSDPPREVRRPWMIPGLVRFGWRALIVADEGVGKSVLLRSVAVMAAQGVHPFAYSRFPPVRTLIVDLENPPDAIYETCRPLVEKARAEVGDDYDPGRSSIWARQGGLDIRQRADRDRLESAIAHVRPDLVCMGPLYQAFRTKGRERDEEAASEAAAVLDSLRTRHDFALVLEHHAPKPTGRTRDLLPFGSSVWMRWPELGIKLGPPGKGDPADSLVLGRFRRDRVIARWPDRIERGSNGWLWQGCWNYRPEELF